MVKRKQADFQPKKLKVGRRLPRGRNVTNTAFKSKKIVVHEQKTKSKLEKGVKELLSKADQSNTKAKISALSQIEKKILANKDTFISDLSDILTKVTGDIQDNDSEVRKTAIKILSKCLELTSDTQIDCFFPLLLSHLSCAMTHCSILVQTSSLELLDAMLAFHPNLTCHSKSVLDNLLNLISCPRIKYGITRRVLNTLIKNNITSQQWRFKVLTHINTFLQAMLKCVNKGEHAEEDEQEVYWDGKTPLYLPIYEGGGLKPRALTHRWHWHLNMESIDSYFCNPQDCKEIVSNLIPLLSDIFAEEISDFKSISKECALDRQVIRNVNIILNVLCCLAEWVEELSKAENDLISWFSSQFSDVICCKFMKGFPYFQHVTWIKTKRDKSCDQAPCMQLNLAMCYLYSLFAFKNVTFGDCLKAVLDYLHNLFKSEYEERVHCIPLLVKTTRNCLQSTDSELIHGILYGMVCTLKVLPDSSPNRKLLFSFFFELSLNPEYRHLPNSHAMKFWFDLLFKEISKMGDSQVLNKKVLKDIKKFCAREYTHFMYYLKKITSKEWLELLKFSDEDFQDMVIHLITHYDNFTTSFLQDITELIFFSTSFSERMVIRLLRRFYLKFSAPTCHDRTPFYQFLINIACDAISSEDIKWQNHELEKFTLAFKSVQDIAAIDVLPSLNWKEHSKVFEVCVECLLLFPEREKIVYWTDKFMRNFLVSNNKLPVHTVIALFKLKNEVFSGYTNKYPEMESHFMDLTFASLLYISVLALYTPDQEWLTYAVSELQNSMIMSRNTTFGILKLIEDDVHNLKYQDGLFFLIRILKFFMMKKLLTNQDVIDTTLKAMEDFVEDPEVLAKKPIWIELCEFFEYEPYM